MFHSLKANRLSTCRTDRRKALRRSGLQRTGPLESLENRTVPSTLLGVKPLIFDPTPLNASSGDEHEIGTIQFERDSDQIQVTYSISPARRAQYDLSAVQTLINDGSAGSLESPGLPTNTESYSHTLTLTRPLNASSLTIDARATIDKRDLAAVAANLPSVATVRVDSSGTIVAQPSYWDTVLTPGWIPSSTDVAGDSLTFAKDPGWATGETVRVVAGFGAEATGLVTPPTATDTTTSATYFVRNLGNKTYSLHTTQSNALAGISAQDITAPIPHTGSIIIAGGNDALSYLGQRPINESRVPASTKTSLTTTTGPLVTATNVTLDTVDLASPVTWANGDRVRVSATGGGLTAGVTYFARVVGANTVSLHTSWAGAQNGSSRVNITAALAASTTVDRVSPDDESITFATDPGWANGTPVRVAVSGGGLNSGTTYFVRNLGSGTYSLFDTLANAANTDADPNPLNGRRDLTASISAGVFANLSTLMFANPHGWATGTVVRASAGVGGLSASTNYYVRALSPTSISLHTSLANAQANVSPVTFNAPITSLITPMFNGWCVDNDRFIGGNEYIANIFSSYDTAAFPDTSKHPKDQFGTDLGLSPINTRMTPATTDLVNDRVTFTTAHGWATGQAVRALTNDNALASGTTYFVRVINSTTVSFHSTAAGASANTGRIDLTAAVAAGTTIFRAESIDFAVSTNWPTATKVKVGGDDGGLLASSTYFTRAVDGNTISFHLTAADALANTGAITLTDPIDPATLVFVPENLVEKPENLDVVNWVLNQQYESRLAAGKAVTATNTNTAVQVPTSTNDANAGLVPIATDANAGIETVDFAVPHGWTTGDAARVAANSGGLSASGTTTYFVRAIDADTISFYDTAARAIAGGLTGLKDLTGPITTSISRVDLASTEDTIRFNAGHGFTTGQAVSVTTNGGGLSTTTTYFLHNVGGDSFSLHTSSPATLSNKVNLTSAVTAGIYLQTDDTVALPAYTWSNGMAVQVSESGGGLSSGVTYFVRAINSTTLAFFANASDATNNVNRIDLSGNFETTLVRPYFTKGDLQRTVWELIETTPGNPGHDPQRVAEILAAAGAAVAIDNASVDYIPGCGGTLAIMIQPFEVNLATSAQVTVAQITIAQIPNYCAMGIASQSLTLPLSALGDRVWEDLNGDGAQDPNEPGLANVTVELLDGGGKLIPGFVTTTDAQGGYLFPGLFPGSYSVRFVLPGGYLFTAPGQGANDADSDADPSSGATSVYILGSGQQLLTVDAGVYRPASLRDFVWSDLNRNGQQDLNEPGIAGVLVRLLDGDGNFIAGCTTTTDSSGKYCFEGLNPGEYAVQFQLPTGCVFTTHHLGSDECDSDADPATGKTPMLALASGEDNSTIDAGMVSITPGNLTGTVFRDDNRDGVQNGAEPGIQGVTVRLRDELGQIVMQTTTDPSGNFAFLNIPGGAYTLEEVQPETYVDGQERLGDGGGTLSANDVVSNIFINGNTATGYTFGEFKGTVDLRVVKSNNATQVERGREVTYTITVVNSGDVTAKGVRLIDPLPYNTVFVGASDSGAFDAVVNQANLSPGTVAWTPVDIPAGQAITRTITLLVGPGTVNQAQIRETLDLRTNWTTTHTVSQFNPLLGTLQSVVVKNSGQMTNGVRVENLSMGASTITVNVTGSLVLNGPSLPTTTATINAPQFAFASPAYDGVLDYGGSSGRTFPTTFTSGSAQQILTAPSALAAFIGTGTLNFTQAASATVVRVGNGSAVNVTTSAQGMLEIIYVYATPSTITNTASVTFDDTNATDPDLSNNQGTDADPIVSALRSAIAPQGQTRITARPIDTSAIAPLAQVAIERWAAAGATPAQLDTMRQFSFLVTPLSDGLLGLSSPSERMIWIDDDAAGHGWFVDPTPRDDREFRPGVGGELVASTSRSPATDLMDLLTVIEHELGHVIGLDDLASHADADSLMTETLAPSIRRAASPANLAASVVETTGTGTSSRLVDHQAASSRLIDEVLRRQEAIGGSWLPPLPSLTTRRGSSR